MKIPKEIIGKNKLRDLDICRLYIEGLTAEEIKSKRKLTIGIRAIQHIISKNAAFVNPRVAWPKTKRIHNLQRIAQRYQERALSDKKDYLDVSKELRAEIEGDKAIVDASQHTHYTIHQLTKEVHGQRINEASGETLPGAGFVLAESLRRQSMVEANRSDGSGPGPRQGDGTER